MARLVAMISGDNVQNVGYRPFLYAIMKRFNLVGIIENLGNGHQVAIEAWGSRKNIDEFYSVIQVKKPIAVRRISVAEKIIDNEKPPSPYSLLNEKMDLMIENTGKFVEVGKSIDRSIKGMRTDIKVLPKQIAKELKPIRVRQHKRKLR